MEGKHATAARTCRDLLDSMHFDADPEAYAAVLIKLVTFLDHDGQHLEALDEVNRFLCRAPKTRLALRQRAWAVYHKGICLRRLGRFDEVRQVLRELRQQESHSYSIASLHQLGVVELEEAKQLTGTTSSAHYPAVVDKLQQAHQLFEECLNAREALEYRLEDSVVSNTIDKLISSTHRTGFTLRRLGETLVQLGQYHEALDFYHRALVIFAWHHCQRYVTETYKEIAKLVGRPQSSVKRGDREMM